jgi:hypothetical protein
MQENKKFQNKREQGYEIRIKPDKRILLQNFFSTDVR